VAADAEIIAKLTIVSLKKFFKPALMNCRVYINPAVQTILILTSLDKSARGADDADGWKSEFIGITKDTFFSVVNLKRGIAHRASSFTLPGFDTLIRAKWAG
jgi:hypothetical protein